MLCYNVSMKFPIFFVTTASLITLFFFFDKGFTLTDEGYILTASSLVLDGKVPYRDFSFIYTPLSLYFTAAAMKLWGEAIIVGRILVLLISAYSITCLYIISRRITESKLVVVLSTLIFTSWIPTHHNAPLPVVFCVAFFLSALGMLIKHIDERHNMYILFAGFFTALSILTKQNFGAAMLISLFLYILMSKRIDKNKVNFWQLLKYMLLGFVIPIGFIAAAYLQQGILRVFIEQTFLQVLERVVFAGNLSSSFNVEPNVLYRWFKILFYYSGFVLALYLGYVSLKRKNSMLACVSMFVAPFWLLGLRPETDYVHLTGIFGLIGLVLTGVWRISLNKRVKAIWLMSMCVLVILGYYTALYKEYMRWGAPIIASTQYSGGRLGMYLSPHDSDLVKKVLSATSNYTQDCCIYSHPHLPMIYFITSIKPATRYLSAVDYINDVEKKELVRDLAAHRPQIVFSDIGMDGNSIITSYLEEYYVHHQVSGNFYVLKLKNE